MTQNKHKKLKPRLVASYDIQPGNGWGLFLFWHIINLSLTYSLTYSPGNHTGQSSTELVLRSYSMWGQVTKENPPLGIIEARLYRQDVLRLIRPTAYSYCRTKNYAQQSFSYSGPAIWNSVPLTVHDSSMSLTQFCTRLKTEMFCRAHDRS